MADKPDTVKYLILQQSGEFVIEIPRDWKITFAAVNPAGQTMGRDLHCVRVWEKKDQLRAVFCDCRGLRDLSIPLARKVQKETGSTNWTMDSEGGFERSAKRELESSWEGPEDPEDIPF